MKFEMLAESRAKVTRMGTPTRHVNSIWLFEEVTEEFSEDINPFVASNELLSALASSPLVEPGRVETTRDAPSLVVVLHLWKCLSQ